MISKIISEDSIPECWEQGLDYILKNGIMIDGERGKTKTVFNLTFEIKKPLQNMVHSKSVYSLEFLEAYKNQLLFGSKQTFDYTYHERIYENPIDQIATCVETLNKNKYSRRALFTTRLPKIDAKMENIPCLVSGIFFFNGFRLNLDCLFRSWDIFGGMPANLYALSFLLKDVADKTGLVPGRLIVKGVHPHVYKYDINSAYDILEYFKIVPLFKRIKSFSKKDKVLLPLWQLP